MELKTLDVAMRHSHTTFVALLIIAMLVTVVMAFQNRNQKDKKSPKWLKLSHMILGTVTLVTGVYLMFRAPDGVQPYIWVKLLLVIVAMGMGISGSRRNSVPLTATSLVLLGGIMSLAYARPAFLTNTPEGLASDEEVAELLAEADQNGKNKKQKESDHERNMRIGKSLYYKYTCSTCHGEDGAYGFQGAKNLAESSLTDEEIGEMIKNGKGLMPAAQGVKDAEVDMLVYYVKSFRKKK